MRRPIAAVVGTGRGVPDTIMTNNDFAAIGIETSHEWIVERSGIVERRIAKNGVTTASMAADPEMQRELSRINAKFSSTKPTGLRGTDACKTEWGSGTAN